MIARILGMQFKTRIGYDVLPVDWNPAHSHHEAKRPKQAFPPSVRSQKGIQSGRGQVNSVIDVFAKVENSEKVSAFPLLSGNVGNGTDLSISHAV
jgi:hypothetical protein